MHYVLLAARKFQLENVNLITDNGGGDQHVAVSTWLLFTENTLHGQHADKRWLDSGQK